MKRLLILLACLCLSAHAELKLSGIFSDHAVLQQGIAVPIWGWADADADVMVSFGGQTQSAKADAAGKWMVKLPAMSANRKGQELKVSSAGKTLTRKDILVGEVWICSGQSNMEWSINGAKQPDVEKKNGKHPLLRHIKINRIPSDAKRDEISTNWDVAEGENIGSWTAVGYFFGRKLVQDLNVPVGLINSSWGGTKIEPWTPTEGFELVKEENFAKPILQRIEEADPTSEVGKKKYQQGIERIRDWAEKAEAAVAAGKYPSQAPAMPGLGTSHQDPTRLYNGMIHPFLPYGIKGAVWYQGESNGGDGELYIEKLKALVGGWRTVWNQGDFPFYWVQLANFQGDNEDPAGGDGYARIREGMRLATDIKNTGMAVIIDIGEERDIHPRNKQDVGLRLAHLALNKDYGKEVVATGPWFTKQTIEGDKIRLHFDNIGKGLIVGEKNELDPIKELKGGTLKRFAVAGDDKKWEWADAVIDGETVVVSSSKVKKPVAVRYAYSSNPKEANLYNREGIPATPFRTDDW